MHNCVVVRADVEICKMTLCVCDCVNVELVLLGVVAVQTSYERRRWNQSVRRENTLLLSHFDTFSLMC